MPRRHFGHLAILVNTAFLRPLSILFFMCLWLYSGGPPCLARQIPPRPATKEIQPAMASAAWYYERGLMNFVFEHHSEAERDLTEALRKQPKFPEANYLLSIVLERLKRPTDAVTALQKVIDTSSIEHVPARLRLITLLLALERPKQAAPHVEALVKHLQLGGTEIAGERIRLQTMLANSQTKPAQVYDLAEHLTDRINIYLLDSAAHYQAATFDQGLTDGLVGLEYVNLLRRQSSAKDVDTAAVLQKFLDMRRGFSPAAYLQMGEVAENQTQLRAAVSAFETAIRQMRWLNLNESNGDFSGVHFRELQQKVTVQPVKSGKQ